MNSELKNSKPGCLTKMLADLVKGTRESVVGNVGRRTLEQILLQTVSATAISSGELSIACLSSPETRATVEQISQDLATIADIAPKLAGIYTETAETAKNSRSQIDDLLNAATSAAAAPVAEETSVEAPAAQAASPA